VSHEAVKHEVPPMNAERVGFMAPKFEPVIVTVAHPVRGLLLTLKRVITGESKER
jgi:hypothetical protein